MTPHDKELVRRRFSKNLRSYNDLAEVQRRIADRLAERIVQFAPGVRRGVELGAGTGFLTRNLVAAFPQTEWLVNDIVPQSRDFLPRSERITFQAGDGEELSLEVNGRRPDLITSASAVQWFDDLPGFICRAGEALETGGLLAVSTFGTENCREITATTGQGLDYFPLPQMAAWLRENGFEIVHLEEWSDPLRFETPVDVLRHLRLTGVNAVSPVRWTPARLRQFETEYRERYQTPQGVTLTFHPIIWIGKKM